ncbi:hypothetical protein LKMONMHP_4016 [Methylobacterium organophilum]|uniref:Ferredoxin n=2 Tax=Methylobacterium organophilum TaxID=410 RepID=A0ABQ4TGH5_METOR|nr:hypothetical protein LKMONMHP_4016 [Methylobacterium organophilum]
MPGLLARMSAISAKPGGLRVSVDLNRCQGYAQCCYAAPEQFALHGHEALFYDPAPSAEAWGAVERARVACPVQAIRLECPTADRDAES